MHMEGYYPITQAQHAHCPISTQIGQAVFQELFVSLLINMGKKIMKFKYNKLLGNG